MGVHTPVLRPASGPEDFRLAPVDRYIAAPGWLAFYRRHFSGIVLGREVTAAPMAQLFQLLPIRFSPPAEPHPSLVDIRRVRNLDPAVFEMRVSLIERYHETWPAYVTRVAIVHPPGMIGALAMGIRAIAPMPFEEQFFVDIDDAMAWLGREDDRPLLDELDRLAETAFELAPLVGRLRALLDDQPRLALGAAARRLALSRRSLQRRLAEAGTSYQHELTLATVRAAQRRLLASSASVSQVAIDVGCSSPQHLSLLFRKIVGDTPSRWRRRELARLAA